MVMYYAKYPREQCEEWVHRTPGIAMENRVISELKPAERLPLNAKLVGMAPCGKTRFFKVVKRSKGNVACCSCKTDIMNCDIVCTYMGALDSGRVVVLVRPVFSKLHRTRLLVKQAGGLCTVEDKGVTYVLYPYRPSMEVLSIMEDKKIPVPVAIAPGDALRSSIGH